MMAHADWGGQRPGAGRPLKGIEKRERVSATLPPAQIAAIDQLAEARCLSRSDALSLVVEIGLGGYAEHRGRRRQADGAELPIPPDRLELLQAMAQADSIFHLRQSMLLAASAMGGDPAALGQALRVLGMQLPTFGGEPVTVGRDQAWSWDAAGVLCGAEWTDDSHNGLRIYSRDQWAAMHWRDAAGSAGNATSDITPDDFQALYLGEEATLSRPMLRRSAEPAGGPDQPKSPR